jgi:hypothetical protein
MPFDWRQFLIVAHELRNDSRESVQRTSLGRAYYYVYNLGLINARRQGYRWIRGAGGSHQQLWNWFQNHSDPIIKQMGIEANRMHSKRLDSDYEDARIPNIASEVKTQIARAQTFESTVHRQRNQPPPATLAP